MHTAPVDSPRTAESITIVPIPLADLVIDNARVDYGTEAEQAQLFASVELRQLEPIQVARDRQTVLHGNRRVFVCRKRGKTHLNGIYTDDSPDKGTLRRLQLAFDVNNRHLSPFERSLAALEAKQAHAELTGKKLAELIGIDPPLLSKWLCIEKLGEKAYQLYQQGKLGLTEVTTLAQHTPEEQDAMLAKHKGGRRELAEASRVIRNGDAPSSTEKVGSIRLPLGEFTFSVKGPGLSLDLAIVKAEAAVERLKAARNDGHTARTIKDWLTNKKPKKARKPRAAKA